MKPKKNKEFNTAIRVNKQLVCQDCKNEFEATTEPEQIKQGMIIIEDVCPDCGSFVSVVY